MRILFLTQDANSGNLTLASAMMSEMTSRGWCDMGTNMSSFCSITPRTYACENRLRNEQRPVWDIGERVCMQTKVYYSVFCNTSKLIFCTRIPQHRYLGSVIGMCWVSDSYSVTVYSSQTYADQSQ